MTSPAVPAGAAAAPWVPYALETLQQRNMMGALPSNDALSTLLQRYAPDHIRTRSELLPEPPGSASDLASVARRAVQENHWRRVATTAGTAVAQPVDTEKPNVYVSQRGSGSLGRADVQHVLAWWHLRLVALWKLRLYGQVQAESAALSRALGSVSVVEEGVVLSLDAGTFTGESTSLLDSPLVPFCLRILFAQAQFVRGDQRGAVEALWSQIHMSETRLRLVLASMLIEMQVLSTAVTVLEPLVALCEEGTSPNAALPALLMRLYLQMGAMPEARTLLGLARQASARSEAPTDAHLLASHDALLHMMERRTASGGDNGGVPTADLGPPEAWAGNEALVNSIAMEALYRGDLTTSTRVLERFLSDAPTQFATAPGIAGNLITLHAMGPESGVPAKTRVARAIVEWAGDDPSCIDPRVA
ncbi:hypothetical protein MSPP1_000070 [Malassezia sp. CBS 17886]|nr:hypothetical protein MSPP1_000070 [Malassezia sp. CBS 17886]